MDWTILREDRQRFKDCRVPTLAGPDLDLRAVDRRGSGSQPPEFPASQSWAEVTGNRVRTKVVANGTVSPITEGAPPQRPHSSPLRGV